jgi:hypothetical protein
LNSIRVIKKVIFLWILSHLNIAATD